MTTDDDLDRLYSLPLREFVPARDALAQRLDGAGEPSAAAMIKGLAKPSLSAWVVNQLVRNRRDLVSDVLAAVDRVRAAHAGALEQRDDILPLSEANKDERDALARVAEHTPSILDEVGYVASAATIERAVQSLRRAASEPEARQLLELGRLTTDHGGDPVETSSGVAGTSGAPAHRVAHRPPRDTIDLEMGAALRQAELKRAEQHKRRQIEENRREADDRKRSLQRRRDALKRSIEAARAAETRFEREHINAERERKEAERRLEDKTQVSRRISDQLEQARAERAQVEAELAGLAMTDSSDINVS